MHPTKKQLAQFQISFEKATEFLYEKEKRSTEFLDKIIKEYFTLEFIKPEDGILCPLPSKFPEDKKANVVWIIEVQLTNWKIVNGLKDIETNKIYFHKTDIDLILKSFFKN